MFEWELETWERFSPDDSSNLGKLLAQLNNIVSPLVVITWILWGFLRIPNASSLDELRRYEQLTGTVEVPILLLFVVLCLSLKPLISKEVFPRKWRQSWRFPLAIFSFVLFIVASYIWLDRVVRNEPPRITKLWIEEATLLPLVDSSVEARASDPDGDEPFFLWVSEQIPFEQPRTNEVHFRAPQVPGDYEIIVIVFDRKGAYDKKEVRIHVISKQAE